MKSIKLYSILLFTIFTLTVRAQDEQFTKVTSWEALFAKAKKENKMVFIDSYFVGCFPCKKMDDEVFTLSEVKKLMNDNFISVKIDFLKEDLGKQLQVKYAVTGFPTFLLLNSNGQLVSRFSGYQEADKFQQLLKDAILRSKKGDVMNGFSSSLIVNYPPFYPSYFTERKAISSEDLSTYLKGKDITAEANAVPFLVVRNLSSELSDYFLKNYSKFESGYGKELVWSKRNGIIAAKMKTAIPQRDDLKFAAFLGEIKPQFSTAEWPYVKLDIAEEYYYKLHKDHKAFFKFAAANYNDDENRVRYMEMYLHSPKIDDEEKKLFADWMKLVVKENSGYDVLGVAARVMKEQNDFENAKKYATWGLKKAKLVNKDAKYFESFLN